MITEESGRNESKLCPAQSALFVVIATLLAVFFVLLITLWCTTAHAKDVIIRDKYGTQIGRVTSGYSGGGVDRKVILDKHGDRVGTIERYKEHSHGTTNVYTEKGDKAATFKHHTLRLEESDDED